MGISSLLLTILSIMKTIFALLLLIVIVEHTQARYSYCQKPNEACLKNSDCCVGLCQAQLRSYYGFCTEPRPSIPFGSKTHLQLLTLLKKLEDLRQTNHVNRIGDEYERDDHDRYDDHDDDEDDHDHDRKKQDDHHHDDHHHHHVIYHS